MTKDETEESENPEESEVSSKYTMIEELVECSMMPSSSLLGDRMVTTGINKVEKFELPPKESDKVSERMERLFMMKPECKGFLSNLSFIIENSHLIREEEA